MVISICAKLLRSLTSHVARSSRPSSSLRARTALGASSDAAAPCAPLGSIATYLNFGIRVLRLPSDDVDAAQDLGDRGDVVLDQPQRLVAQRAHALRRSRARAARRRGACSDDELLDLVGDRAAARRRRCGRSSRCRAQKLQPAPRMNSVFGLAAPLLVERELVGASARTARGRTSQMRRTRRWATTPTTDDATRNDSMPMSRKRCSAAIASVACSDESTRWPVSADCTAMRAVSTSRISPTRMTSGSWRRIDLSPPAKVMPACSLIWIWLIDGKTYSTGSSIVMMLRSELLISPSDA